MSIKSKRALDGIKQSNVYLARAGGMMNEIRLNYAAAGAVALWLMASDSQATTFRSTLLRDLAQEADATVQGTVTLVESRLDAQGVPWTLYTIAIENMLVGEAANSDVTFRCMGGPLGPERLLEMVAAPEIVLGESIVFFHRPGGICDVSGFEHGLFWIRDNADGIARLVNHEGFAIGGFAAEGPILSAEYVPSALEVSQKLGTSGGLQAERSATALAEVDISRPPPAELQPILDELAAFAAANVVQPKIIDSVNGVVDVPVLADMPAPEDQP